MARGKAKLEMPSLQNIVDKFGLDAGGRTQTYFTSELHRLADPYVPYGQTGNLKNESAVVNDGTAIKYSMPYANVLWHGEIMVDPETGYAGIFMGDDIGWRSRAGVQKIPASESAARPQYMPINFKFKGGPTRGSQWVFRAFADNQEAIIKSVEQYIKRGG